MKELPPLAAKAFKYIAITTLIFTIISLLWLYYQFPLPKDDDALRLEYLEQYIALIKVIAIGFVVTLISAIVPLILPELRDQFEKYKESRLAYSKAKTAVLYLPDFVCGEDVLQSFQLVADAHRELHYAETFKDMIEKGYLDWYKNPKVWMHYNYWQIVAIAMVLRKRDWSLPREKTQLRKQLTVSLESVHNHFGKNGQKFKRVKWDCVKDSENMENIIEKSLSTVNSKLTDNNG